jgi:hypothetical protein
MRSSAGLHPDRLRCLPGGDQLLDAVFGQVRHLCDLGDAGGALEALLQLRGGALNAGVQLLQPGGLPDQMTPVPQVVPHLARDQVGGKGAEAGPPLGREAVHGPDQADVAFALQVFLRLAARELPRDGLDQRPHVLHDLVPRPGIARTAVLLQQLRHDRVAICVSLACHKGFPGKPGSTGDTCPTRRAPSRGVQETYHCGR